MLPAVYPFFFMNMSLFTCVGPPRPQPPMTSAIQFPPGNGSFDLVAAHKYIGNCILTLSFNNVSREHPITALIKCVMMVHDYMAGRGDLWDVEEFVIYNETSLRQMMDEAMSEWEHKFSHRMPDLSGFFDATEYYLALAAQSAVPDYTHARDLAVFIGGSWVLLALVLVHARRAEREAMIVDTLASYSANAYIRRNITY